MTPQSAKAKGRRLQQKVRDLLISMLGIDSEDVKSTSMGAGGEDITLSNIARHHFPYSIECKKNKAFSVYKYYDQACANSGKHEPLVVIEADRRKPLVLVDLETFIGLHKNNE